MRPYRLNLLHGLSMALPFMVAAGAIVMAASVSPTSIVRAALPATAIETDTMVAVAQSGRLGQHVRLVNERSGFNGVASAAQPIQLGDQLTIASRDGGKRIFTVRDIREISPSVVQAVGSTPSPRLLLVTCHDLQNSIAKPLRFIVEAGRSVPRAAQVNAQQDL